MTSPEASDQKLGSARLLVVDDDPSILKLVEAVLSSPSYDVVTCDNATEGLRLLGLTHFDCVITDALMPMVNGYDFVKAIRRHPILSSMPVLMLTRKRDRVDVKRAVDAGVTDYVLKPIDEHLFLDKVGSLLKTGSKRQVFELPVTGIEAQALLNLKCRILSISEADVTISLPVELPSELEFAFSSQLFEKIGITPPLLKRMKSERIVELGGSPEIFYKVKFSFLGLPESELMKIRSWIQKEATRQRG